MKSILTITGESGRDLIQNQRDHLTALHLGVK